MVSSLYAVGAVAQPVAGGFASVGAAEIEQYRRDGFLAVADAVSADAVGAALDDLAAIAADPSRADLLMYEPGVDPQAFRSADEQFRAIRRVWNPVSVDSAAAITAIATEPGLVDVARRAIGSEPTVYQSMALLKPAGIGTEKPWHQDHAYFALPLDTPVVGVWIALDEATVANGCMHLLAGRHRDGPIPHFQRRDWQICDDDVDGAEATAIPLPPGGCLLFDSLLPHGTPPNTSPARRRALQLHFAAADAVAISHEARLAVFGAEGLGAEC